MVSGRGSNGHGAGQIGRGGSGSKRSGSSNERGDGGHVGEKSEAEKKCSDAARLPGSYRYTRYRVAPPPAFSKQESTAYCRRFSSPSAASSSSSSRPPTMPVKMELDDAPAFALAFAPGDYVDDAELEGILPKLGEEAGFRPGEFVDDNHLDTVIGLGSQTIRREADKADEWRLVAKEQGKMYVELGSDGE